MNKRRGERDDKEKRRGKEWRDEGTGEGRISIRGTGIRKKRIGQRRRERGEGAKMKGEGRITRRRTRIIKWREKR